MKQRPTALKKGDTVGVIALSSPLKMDELPLKLSFIESLGLNYKLSSTVAHYEGYLAGTDEERAKAFHEFIIDPEIKAIFCVRGGYGLGRVADKISYPLVEENPKIIWGFSDVTYLHTAVQKYSNLVTFHGPMLTRGDEPLDELSAKMFQQLFQPMEIQYTEAISPLQTIVEGQVRAELIGGNVNRLVSTIGTKYEVDFTNKIVLLEDVGESLERLDGLFNQLRLSRKLEHAAGFMLGSFNKLEENETQQDVYDLFKEFIMPYNKPTLAGFKMGHCEPNIGVPFGVEAILDADNKIVRILPGVEMD
jgi:muramoyltetrapeptide carboxypeptidase